MLDFYLSINNSEEVIHIPVTPSEFTVSSSQGTETFETANYGWIKIIGNTELKTVSWNSFFSMRDYPYLRDRSMKDRNMRTKSKTGVSVNFRYGLSLRLRVSAM